MADRALLGICRALFPIPTAPWQEHGVRAFVVSRLSGLPGVSVRLDLFGNVHARYRRGRAARRFVFAAHMDHPGFEAAADSRGGRLSADFHGGTPLRCFPRARAVFYTARGPVRGRVLRARLDGARRVKRCVLRVEGTVRLGDLGMWDVVPFRIDRGRLFARDCDDLAGVASLLRLFEGIARDRAAGDVGGLFTRAEEVGLCGAVAAAAAGEIPRDALVVSLEASSVRAGSRMGGGPIVRVGDKASLFDPGLSYYLARVAAEAFPPDRKGGAQGFQRRLMDGGTCEATAFCGLGYKASGICVSLGNYHNEGPAGRVAAEYVDLGDLEGMARLCRAAVDRASDYDRIAGRLPARLREEARKAAARLRATSRPAAPRRRRASRSAG